MKFAFSSLFLVFSAVGSVLADEATCKQDVQVILKYKGQKYTPEIAAQTQTEPKSIRVIHPGDAVTMDLRVDRLNINVSDKEIIENAHCG